MIRRFLLAAVLLALGAGVLAAPAGAAPARPVGNLFSATQDTFAHTLRLHGWAHDAAEPSASVSVWFWVDGRYAGHVRAAQPSRYENAKRHISGRHNFTLTVRWTKTAHRVTVAGAGAGASAPLVVLTTKALVHTDATPGARVVAVAKRYVGKARYVEGGASPRGFDCSGYTRYAYAQAHVKTLPHSAEAQRRSMRQIPASKARPGDLVFYLSGGTAYHVAIYAGHGWQYAAATPRDGVRYQKVWSKSVTYGTVTH